MYDLVLGIEGRASGTDRNLGAHSVGKARVSVRVSLNLSSCDERSDEKKVISYSAM